MDNSRPLKILYTTHEPNLTGASRSLLDLLGALDRTEVQPHVLLRKHGEIENKLKELNVDYSIVKSALTVNGPKTKAPNLIKKMINAIAVKQIEALIREHDIDVVHSNSLLSDVGMSAAKEIGVPYVCHARDMVEEDHNLSFVNKKRTKTLMDSASRCIFISEFVASKFKSWINNSTYEIIYDAVDMSSGRRDVGHELFSTNQTRIFLPGRFSRGKGQLEALHAIKLLHDSGVDVVLTLAGNVGQEDYFQKCKRYIEDNSMNYVILESFLDDVTKAYNESDIVLMCSSAEAMGRVTVEGMMSGCFVIGADAGGTSELIQNDKNGLLYESGNPESLATQIKWAVKNKDEAKCIAKSAQTWAKENFEVKVYAQQMVKIYKDIAC